MNSLVSRLNIKIASLQALRTINQIRWRSFLSRRKVARAVILIVVPGLEHLCIPCVRLLSPFFTVILVDNGLPLQASQWLSSAFPHIPYFSLITTVKGAGRHTLSHGEALDLLTRTSIDLIFADPDCYILNPGLIAELFKSLKSNAIASLYADPSLRMGFRIPDTFCFGFQPNSLSYLRKAFNLRIGVVPVLSSPLLDILASLFLTLSIHWRLQPISLERE